MSTFSASSTVRVRPSHSVNFEQFTSDCTVTRFRYHSVCRKFSGICHLLSGVGPLADHPFFSKSKFPQCSFSSYKKSTSKFQSGSQSPHQIFRAQTAVLLPPTSICQWFCSNFAKPFLQGRFYLLAKIGNICISHSCSAYRHYPPSSITERNLECTVSKT